MEKDKAKTIFRIITLVSLFVFGLLIAYLGVMMSPDSMMGKIAAEHFKTVVGLPSAAICSLFFILILQQTSGPIKFEIFTLKFEGSSGEIVLWILVFLSIVLGINTTW